MGARQTGALHVVVGAGPVGTATAGLLAAQGHRVRVVTRRGAGPQGTERVAADAADAARLADLCGGAAAVYNCANPRYHRWAADWPPVAASLLDAAARAGAVLVTTANLYAYGPVDAPMTEDTPLAATGTKGRVRAAMWTDALAAHRAGRVRVAEARGSDYLGPGVDGHAGDRVLAPLAAGRTVRVVGSLDSPHTWTYVPDMARTLVHLAHDGRAWGRAWHVPSEPPRTQRELLADLAAAMGRPLPALRTLPAGLLAVAGLASPVLRELRETLHQLQGPFVMDSTAAARELGLRSTPWAEAVAATAADAVARLGAGARAA